MKRREDLLGIHIEMELIQSTFQASFNARIERLAEQETNELRTIFRYFDTDNDGAVSSDQVLRIFGLLGLDINPEYVRDLEEVYLNEFLKIVDSNVPAPPLDPATQGHASGSAVVVPPLATSSAASNSGALAHEPPHGSHNTVVAPVLDEAALLEQRNVQLWEDEWRAMDSYRRGVVTQEELKSFLKSCFSPFPLQDLERLLELYADPSMPEDSMTLTKTEFLKFRREYTARDAAQSEAGQSSDQEEDEGEGDNLDMDAIQDQEAGEGDGQQINHASQLAKKRRESQADGISVVDGDRELEGIVIDPGVMEDELFVEEDEDAGDDLDDEDPEDVDGADYEPLPHELGGADDD